MTGSFPARTKLPLPEKGFDLGKRLRFFGDGRQKSKVVVMQIGQRLGQRRQIGAVKACRAEQHFDAALQHILGQAIPQMEHGRSATMVDMDTGPAQFQERPPRSQQR